MLNYTDKPVSFPKFLLNLIETKPGYLVEYFGLLWLSAGETDVKAIFESVEDGDG